MGTCTDFTCNVSENAVLLGRACDDPVIAARLTCIARAGGAGVVRSSLAKWLDILAETVREVEIATAAKEFGLALIDAHRDIDTLESVDRVACHYAAEGPSGCDIDRYTDADAAEAFNRKMQELTACC